MTMPASCAALFLAALAFLSLAPAAHAQQSWQPSPQPPALAPAAPPPLPELRPEPPPPSLVEPRQVPPADTLRILIRTTLVAVNHANLTGDYSVLQKLGAPGFQRANPPERLAKIFSAMRQRSLDIGPIVVVEPKLTRQPLIGEQGLLLLSGFFPTRPLQVNFELAFQFVEERWRLFGIFVNTTRADPLAGESDQTR